MKTLRSNRFLIIKIVFVCGVFLLFVMFFRNEESQKFDNESSGQNINKSKPIARKERFEKFTKTPQKTLELMRGEKTSTTNYFKAPQQNHRQIESVEKGLEKSQLLAIQSRGIAAREYQAILPELRSQNDTILQSHRTPTQTNSSEHNKRHTEKIAGASLYKIQLETLPDKADMENDAIPQNTESIESLRHSINSDTNSKTRERNQLLLAGMLIGKDDWYSAQLIYEDLMKQSADPLVLEAVKRNLQIVNQKLQIETTVNLENKQLLELKLAEIHTSFGQNSAAKRIYERIFTSAVTDEIREVAETKLVSLGSKVLSPQ